MDTFSLAAFGWQNKGSSLYLFLLLFLLIGCATISYKITLPEEFGIRAPRQHLRWIFRWKDIIRSAP